MEFEDLKGNSKVDEFLNKMIASISFGNSVNSLFKSHSAVELFHHKSLQYLQIFGQQ